MRRLLAFFPLLLLLLASACQNGNNASPHIPDVVVSAQLNVNSQLYPNLRQDGGYAYISGGYKGIVVVRQNAGQYYAFERACPYDPTAPCALVQMDSSNLFLVDDCCGSQFNLQGQVTGGPAIYGLKQYQTTLSGSVLSVSN
ncbi:Rieske 2Fe-2S domain-containing protein [Pontibacter sp. E15-1]|uniref:Rieske (2Fe-2S) protein n=1 Tax=Pontibacter sp. E15-1 TaxID=2919918 RepID=UPI001F4FC1F4|nr:Rieske 2Fe-2S domain-containing protein [Pontibacter sp. E15-1]MCJ8165429.1 Rieske 2Fe-2S domain-containing protein [Pontibacter sp. E15-1]